MTGRFDFLDSGTSVGTLARIPLVFLLLTLAACGGGPISSSPASGPLSGNWQLSLLQESPPPLTTLSASGFFWESNNALTGSVQIPAEGTDGQCGGVSSVTGTVSGQNVTLFLNEGGTELSLTGIISSDNKSISGDYLGPGGGCLAAPTTGTWNAFLIPQLNGAFTGTLSNSQYMAVLTGLSPPAPIAVSGTLTQGPGMGASNATLTGSITAVGYPCFRTVSLTGTISGQNVYLDVFAYNGEQIGTLGVPGLPGINGTPATVVVGSNGVSLTGTGEGGLSLGVSGACPAITGTSGTLTTDLTEVAFTFQ